MPEWMPGFYQLMHYADAVENITANADEQNLPIQKVNANTWTLSTTKKKFKLSYDVKAEKNFVANSYADSTHGYIVCAGMFFYINNHLELPVSVKINLPASWHNIATGLEPVPGKQNEFKTSNFDILYDCPVLMGNLEELPSFKVKGILHRFIGYKPGNFDKVQFMANLQKIVESAIAVIGDIPYKQYTFIAIGPGRGGIEHLNNTTFGFDGNELKSAAAINRMMNFLAHEYFHHYNVKRIRPFELGPFDYNRENKTNLLWVSEGLSVYYEYMTVKRAGLADDQTLLTDFENNLNSFENSPGRLYQSLIQASYETWSEGPFGKNGSDADKSISYYEKGPLVGMILDFSIRHATTNKKSLDDVMRFLYQAYYLQLRRGFTDAEFQHACEQIAGTSLKDVFEYVYTAKEIDYNHYLSYAGLAIHEEKDSASGKRKIKIVRVEHPGPEQELIFQSWLGDKK
jgi:predicted metalloprotease with PDZ domain